MALINKKCKYCKLDFKARFEHTLYCRNGLCQTVEKNIKSNQSWIEREYSEESKLTLDHKRKFEQGYLYQSKPVYLKKFQSVRG